MMPDPIPACFRGGGAAPLDNGGLDNGGPILATSVYETSLGFASLTWSRAILGLSLRTALRIYAEDEDEEEEEEQLRFHIRPWLLWKRRGTKRFHIKDHRRYRFVDFSWDLTRARFSPGGGPEPVSGFFVAVSADDEMLLVAGDLTDEAYGKSRAERPQNPLLPFPGPISRREHVVLVNHGGRRSYRTGARFGGRDHEIVIDLWAKDKGREVAMSIEVDSKRILQVRRLQWKFRGSEKVEAGGGWIQVSWDLHNWFFQPKDEAADAPSKVNSGGEAAELGQALFLLRFEGEGHLGNGEDKEEAHSLSDGAYNGKNKNINYWSESSGGDGEGRRVRRRRSLRKTDSSSSSTSSASSGSTSTVMDWASAEEVELHQAQGFSLLVIAWKS